MPRPLWDVLERMTAKKPDERYADPAEVAAALAPFAEGHQSGAAGASKSCGHVAATPDAGHREDGDADRQERRVGHALGARR